MQVGEAGGRGRRAGRASITMTGAYGSMLDQLRCDRALKEAMAARAKQADLFSAIGQLEAQRQLALLEVGSGAARSPAAPSRSPSGLHLLGLASALGSDELGVVSAGAPIDLQLRHHLQRRRHSEFAVMPSGSASPPLEESCKDLVTKVTEHLERRRHSESAQQLMIPAEELAQLQREYELRVRSPAVDVASSALNVFREDACGSPLAGGAALHVRRHSDVGPRFSSSSGWLSGSPGAAGAGVGAGTGASSAAELVNSLAQAHAEASALSRRRHSDTSLFSPVQPDGAPGGGAAGASHMDLLELDFNTLSSAGKLRPTPSAASFGSMSIRIGSPPSEHLLGSPTLLGSPGVHNFSPVHKAAQLEALFERRRDLMPHEPQEELLGAAAAVLNVGASSSNRQLPPLDPSLSLARRASVDDSSAAAAAPALPRSRLQGQRCVGRKCISPGCRKLARSTTLFCAAHGGGRRCAESDCVKIARGATPYCIAHGGGRRCSTVGCLKSAQGSTTSCIAHGGGRRCRRDSCPKSARGPSGLCKAHSVKQDRAEELRPILQPLVEHQLLQQLQHAQQQGKP